MINRMAQESFAVDFIKETREKDPGIGGMKLWHMYKRIFSDSSPLGRDRFEDVVDRYGLKVRCKVRKPRTTDSSHGLPTYPNLIMEFIPNAPNQLWVSDITYIAIFEGENHYRYCYLTIVMDAYTEEIKGYSVGESLETHYSLQALTMALKSLAGHNRNEMSLIHHSDRGVQYASKEYISLLKANDIRISMTENGNPKDNPQAERINSTVKNELLKGRRFHSIEEVQRAVARAVAFYNNERPHMSIGMMTPVEAAQICGARDMKWISYRELAIKKRLQGRIAENGLLLLSCQGSSSGLHPPVNP